MQRLKQLSNLQIALLLSLGVHAALLTLRVVDPEAFDRILQDTSLEVVLVNASSAEAPTQAQVIAQRNLAGGGDAEQGRATSPLPPAPANQAGDSLDEAQRQIEQMQLQQMQLLAQMKRELARLATTDQARPSAQDQPAARAEEERRRQLLDQLAQIEKRINDENARPRRRYVSPSAREGVHAIYYDTLRSRIEDIGTRNFPEDKGVKLYGELSMLLEIDSLGRVVEAEIIQTSGNRLLDRKAQSIVRGAGPYGHFTPQMRAQFDRLVFVSRFRFTREQGLQATVEENQNAPQGR
ncbi:protein TonB [Sphaerotilus sulfidivorans]|jgi:protein TonB|uniref:Energy transducer TonB n=1 Tax=Sphaerotilus sulfidivorans TaxID=639200 RepID=A0A5C1PW40_9BURK|nr:MULTISPECIES: energy transducer TonB [Sphaerotilus]GIX53595.1 energy transducer TonB [Sphaerotilus natans]MCK6401794.1 energy transducer TonB [Sphaerotilus sulfidivorans]NZD44901.1 energy transducer TonB [Sphaerotilus sulfidivorans]QEM99566.1 energy transducer TonB [Sphaerotilus sulfidivorans]GKQ57806.1 energy transducer TonB [Sphaerotilus sp. FB-3]